MENPGRYTTKEIAEQLKLRGIKTNAKRFQATVYATIKESPHFAQTQDKKWTLANKGTGGRPDPAPAPEPATVDASRPHAREEGGRDDPEAL